MDTTELTGPPGPWEPAEASAPEPAAEQLPAALTAEPLDAEWPWDTLHAEQEAREGTFTEAMRYEYRWDEEAFSRLEDAMRAACEALDGHRTIERWVGEGFWCWTAVIPELTSHPHFSTTDTTYLRRCLARLRDLGSWFFNGSSPYGPGHVWEPVEPA
jgi:hypothetical protein